MMKANFERSKSDFLQYLLHIEYKIYSRFYTVSKNAGDGHIALQHKIQSITKRPKAISIEACRPICKSC